MATSTSRLYGELYRAGSLKGALLSSQESIKRFIGLARGQSVDIVDTQSAVPTVVATHRGVRTRDSLEVVHPDGVRLIVRDRCTQWLRVYGIDGLLAEVKTATSLVTWQGELVERWSSKVYWDLGDEHCLLSEDGAHIVLATHDVNGKPVILLFETDGLALVDTVTALYCHEHYPGQFPHREPRDAMQCWQESWMGTGALDPGLFLSRHVGGYCAGFFAFRVIEGRLVMLNEAELARAIYGCRGRLEIDADRLHALALLPEGGMLVVDRNMMMSRLVWPADASTLPQAQCFPAETLRDDSHRIVVPLPPRPSLMGEDEGDSEEDEFWCTWYQPLTPLSVTDRHILLNLGVDDDRYTVGLLALDARTLGFLGIVARPTSRTQFTELQHLGGDLFAGEGATVTTFWRLKSSHQ